MSDDPERPSGEEEDESATPDPEEVAEDAADVVAEHAAEAAEEAVEAVEEVPIEEIQELAARAETSLDAFLEAEEHGEADKHLLEDLWDVAEEAAELLETVEVDALPEAIEDDAGIEEFGEFVKSNKEMLGLPSTAEEGEHEVAYRELLELVELSEVWDAVDLREFMRNKRELDEELDDVSDYAGDDAGGTDDDGPFETDDDWRADPTPSPDLGELGTEGRQAAVQQKVTGAVEEFRESILDAHERLEEIVEKNRERGRTVDQPDSRNPTAVSTLPTGGRGSIRSGTHHSTVPEETLYSSAPNHRRIYGSRFDDQRRRREEDDDE
jgi:chemotaxis regulatin CheY-phosphate phosphatase CheZ